MMNVERVLREYGQFLRPMGEAPRDGRKILGISKRGSLVVFWDANPSKLAGAIWVEEKDADRGYLDRYFRGWLDLRDFRPLDHEALARLLIAHIDDARAADDRDVFKVLGPS